MFRALAKEFGDELSLAAGTVLDAAAAREAIAAGARVIVSPAVVPEVIATAHRYGAACYAGAFTATECLTAMQAGADMVKIFPAAVAGPAYMTNLRMVYPEINLIPSGGVSLDNAADFIRSGASAVSGARNFFNREAVAREGLAWITDQVATYIDSSLRPRPPQNRCPEPDELPLAEEAASNPSNTFPVVRIGRPLPGQVRKTAGAACSPRRQRRVVAGIERDVGLQGMAGWNRPGGVEKEMHQVGARRRHAALPGG